MREDVPPSLHPPVPLALAKAVESVPAVGALPGGCLYEPKWDGYRLCALAGSGGVSLWSRQGKDLTRYLGAAGAAGGRLGASAEPVTRNQRPRPGARVV
jgi:ATP-dependent DNA ligase